MKKVLTLGLLALAGICSQSAMAQEKPAPAPVAAPAEKADLTQVLEGKLVDADNKPVSIKGKKAIVFYYSAHWCGPCRQATPKLVEFYNSLPADLKKDVEFVFVSGDKDEASMLGYMKEAKMPWAAVKFDARGECPVKNPSRGIPHIVIMKPDMTKVTNGHPAALINDFQKTLEAAVK